MENDSYCTLNKGFIPRGWDLELGFIYVMCECMRTGLVAAGRRPAAGGRGGVPRSCQQALQVCIYTF